MKQCLAFLLVLLLAVQGGIVTSAASATEIKIYLDGERLETDVAPYIASKVNVTMVPLRVISEGIGATVGWNQASKTVRIQGFGNDLSLTQGQKTAIVNGNTVQLSSTVTITKGRVMVPLRFVSEHLGLTVKWNQSAKTIHLTTANLWPTEPEIPSIPGQPEGTEMRGAWISTINGDWPKSGSTGNIEKQKQDFIQELDALESMGMNTVFVQLRGASDAIYPSTLVPWNRVLTGKQGTDPGYDPVAFMIEEVHKRGMEFHAWFNPFRANTTADTSKNAANHIVNQHPEWIVTAKNQMYINPGIPEARQDIINVIMEVVNRYDIDGVHLDDYFYPSNVTFNDTASFKTYNTKNFKNIDDWRVDNINMFVKSLGEQIKASKPSVEYGISPFGVWRNIADDATGSNTKAGVTAYDDMHADVRTWIQEEWIDYVAPQIYWSMSLTAARYDILVDWWVNEVKGTDVDLYIGHSPYKLGTTEVGWQSANEIINQLKYNEQYDEVDGDIYFSAQYLTKNPLGLIEALKAYYDI
ncbi:family 10 glycosylhydrolase [Neobacillus mesonae]|nr:family 10 glycosylhydrolase [Neobacillus mesonae]